MARSGDSVSAAQPEVMKQCAALLVGGFNPTLALADVLRVNQRSVQRWLAGQNAVPPALWRELLGIVEEREAALRQLRAALEAELGQGESR